MQACPSTRSEHCSVYMIMPLHETTMQGVSCWIHATSIMMYFSSVVPTPMSSMGWSPSGKYKHPSSIALFSHHTEHPILISYDARFPGIIGPRYSIQHIILLHMFEGNRWNTAFSQMCLEVFESMKLWSYSMQHIIFPTSRTACFLVWPLTPSAHSPTTAKDMLKIQNGHPWLDRVFLNRPRFKNEPCRLTPIF